MLFPHSETGQACLPKVFSGTKTCAKPKSLRRVDFMRYAAVVARNASIMLRIGTPQAYRLRRFADGKDMSEDESDEIDLRCPQIVADNAAKGLELRARFRRGGTEIGVARAEELKR